MHGYVSVNLIKILFLSLNQRTPLHVAASKGRDHTVEYFVNKGADISNNDKAGVSSKIFVCEVRTRLFPG